MPTDGTVADIYRRMYAIRYYNRRTAERYEEGAEIPSGIHGSEGQEAPAVGVCGHLQNEDWAFTYHRGSHVAIGKGVGVKALVAEQLGKEGASATGRRGNSTSSTRMRTSSRGPSSHSSSPRRPARRWPRRSAGPTKDNDVLTVYEEAGEAIERARRGEGPTLLEVRTYRAMGHFFADPEDYRSFGVSGELIARATEDWPGALDAAARLAVPDTPVPYSLALKEELDPGAEEIAAEVRRMVG